MELVVCVNPAVVNAIEDKRNRKLLRLPLADIKESLRLVVIGMLEPFDIATKCLSCDGKPFAELCSISQVLHFRGLVAYEYFGTLTGFSNRLFDVGGRDVR